MNTKSTIASLIVATLTKTKTKMRKNMKAIKPQKSHKRPKLPTILKRVLPIRIGIIHRLLERDGVSSETTSQ